MCRSRLAIQCGCCWRLLRVGGGGGGTGLSLDQLEVLLLHLEHHHLRRSDDVRGPPLVVQQRLLPKVRALLLQPRHLDAVFEDFDLIARQALSGCSLD